MAGVSLKNVEKTFPGGVQAVRDFSLEIQEPARILSLTDLLARRPKALSGGQRQRVAVGRAIVRKPAVFLFDEPLSNLDAKLRVQMRVEISRLHGQLEATMIYVTHDQIEAMTMGDRIVVMKDGIIHQVADPITLYDRPVDRFVAGFIGTPPMNFFEGRIGGRNGALVVEAPGGMALRVPESGSQALAPYRDRPVILGLRPEDIGSGVAGRQSDGASIRAKVDVIEPMGSESYVYLNTGAVSFISRADSHQRFEVGRETDLPVYMEKAHFFDTATEKRIG